jgi:hypothetical protein
LYLKIFLQSDFLLLKIDFIGDLFLYVMQKEKKKKITLKKALEQLVSGGLSGAITKSSTAPLERFFLKIKKELKFYTKFKE